MLHMGGTGAGWGVTDTCLNTGLQQFRTPKLSAFCVHMFQNYTRIELLRSRMTMEGEGRGSGSIVYVTRRQRYRRREDDVY